MLALTSLSSGYGSIPILSEISFSLGQGECLGLWGHNGMGKSTLLSSIMGYLPATGGQISFAGCDVTTEPPHNRARLRLGLVPQGRQIFPALSVYDNLRMGARLAEEPAAKVIEDVLDLFPRVRRLVDRTGGQLSGGEQQLVALARCLCGRPNLIMLDEPTEGIQPSINEEIAETLSLLHKQRGLSMLVVEQKRDFIASLADRVLVIQKGRIVRELTVNDLMAHEQM